MTKKGIKKDKKAWIRIAEASLAIMMLASVILITVTKQVEKQDISEVMYRLQHKILDEGSKNDTFRNAVLSENSSIVSSFIDERLPPGFNFNVSICGITEPCKLEITKEGAEIYVDDVLISSTLQDYNPKELKFYVWMGEEEALLPPPPAQPPDVGYKFYIKNAAGENVASLSEDGNIILKGTCTRRLECIVPADSFIIQNPAGETVAYIDTNGNLCIETGDCSDGYSDCDTVGDGSFIVKNQDNDNVIYIDSVGDLCLIGTLIQNGSP